jgi:hypothetical protein
MNFIARIVAGAAVAGPRQPVNGRETCVVCWRFLRPPKLLKGAEMFSSFDFTLVAASLEPVQPADRPSSRHLKLLARRSMVTAIKSCYIDFVALDMNSLFIFGRLYFSIAGRYLSC